MGSALYQGFLFAGAVDSIMFRLTVVALACIAASAHGFRRNGPLPRGLAMELGVGRQPLEDDSKIVGGTDASPDQFPYQLSWRRIGGSHFCGAEIFTNDIMITAAHCCVGGTDNTEVLAGLIQRSDESAAQIVEVVGSTVHPSYGENGYADDICLLRLASPLEFNKHVGPVPMPIQGDTLWSTGTATVSGWGTLHSGDFLLPDRLQFVEVPLVTDEVCADDYPRDFDAPTMICAGQKDKDSCQGDSGGPMTCEGDTDTPLILCGIVSWGYGCAEENRPGVYTEVSHYIDWINARSNWPALP